MSNKYHINYVKTRAVKSYPPEPIRNQLKAYCDITNDSQSEFITEAIKEKLDRQPEILKEQIKRQSRNSY